jgi:hypothetical protein
MKIILMACGRRKVNGRVKAEDLYVGRLFGKEITYAKALKTIGEVDEIFILSAKYGLLRLDDEVEAYNETLVKKKEKERKVWARMVLDQLAKVADLETDEFIFFAGKPYVKHLLPLIKNYSLPVQGMGIGWCLHYYTEGWKAIRHLTGWTEPVRNKRKNVTS